MATECDGGGQSERYSLRYVQAEKPPHMTPNHWQNPATWSANVVEERHARKVIGDLCHMRVAHRKGDNEDEGRERNA